jgi:hypothetical protein
VIEVDVAALAHKEKEHEASPVNPFRANQLGVGDTASAKTLIRPPL